MNMTKFFLQIPKKFIQPKSKPIKCYIPLKDTHWNICHCIDICKYGPPGFFFEKNTLNENEMRFRITLKKNLMKSLY